MPPKRSIKGSRVQQNVNDELQEDGARWTPMLLIPSACKQMCLACMAARGSTIKRLRIDYAPC